jgi:hypothetical protein
MMTFAAPLEWRDKGARKADEVNESNAGSSVALGVLPVEDAQGSNLSGQREQRFRHCLVGHLFNVSRDFADNVFSRAVERYQLSRLRKKSAKRSGRRHAPFQKASPFGLWQLGQGVRGSNEFGHQIGRHRHSGLISGLPSNRDEFTSRDTR